MHRQYISQNSNLYIDTGQHCRTFLFFFKKEFSAALPARRCAVIVMFFLIHVYARFLALIRDQ
jgi:hypothetical protein